MSQLFIAYAVSLLTLIILDTIKQIFWHTVKTQMKSGSDKINFQGQKHIKTCDPGTAKYLVGSMGASLLYLMQSPFLLLYSRIYNNNDGIHKMYTIIKTCFIGKNKTNVKNSPWVVQKR